MTMKKIGMLFLLFGLIWTNACKKSDGPVTPQGMLGTMVRINCGASTLGDLWIKGDDGTYYQPCVQDFATLIPVYYQDGDRVSFAKRALRDNEHCSPICGTVLLDGKTEQIGLTSLNLLSKREQFKLTGKLENLSGKLDGCGWVFHSDQGKTYEVLDWFAGVPLLEDEPLEVLIEPVNVGSICMRGTPAVFLTAKYAKNGYACKASIKQAEIPKEKMTVHVLNARQENNNLVLMLGFSGCNFDPTPITLYTTDVNLASDPQVVQATLANMPEEQMCQAYFQKEVCFDLSNLKATSRYFNIILRGYNQPIPIQLH
ncbi:hypothetical protein MASR2M44_26760 [Bacteroidota bacterium]